MTTTVKKLDQLSSKTEDIVKEYNLYVVLDVFINKKAVLLNIVCFL